MALTPGDASNILSMFKLEVLEWIIKEGVHIRRSRWWSMDVELTSPHEHIKNISTCATTLSENYLETGRKTPVQPRL